MEEVLFILLLSIALASLYKPCMRYLDKVTANYNKQIQPTTECYRYDKHGNIIKL